MLFSPTHCLCAAHEMSECDKASGFPKPDSYKVDQTAHSISKKPSLPDLTEKPQAAPCRSLGLEGRTFRLPLVVNARPQMLHTKGFSPV